jgi:RimJ/RimL family protein N-acetyltransferase
VGKAAAMASGVAGTIPGLHTERLVLRAPHMADFDAFAAIFAADRKGHLGDPLDRDAVMEVFLAATGGWALRGHGLWSVERAADAVLLGFVLLDHETGDPEPELGWLFLKSSEGQGYATEAAASARAFARDSLGWATVVSYISEDNARSIAVAMRLGAAPDADTVDGCLVWRHDLTRDQDTNVRTSGRRMEDVRKTSKGAF